MNRIKKYLVLLLSVIFVCQSLSPVYAAAEKEDYIEILQAIGVIKDDVSADAYVTRSGFIKMAVNILCGGADEGNGKVPFDDVKTDDESYDYIRTAYEYGIISGSGNGKFEPNAAIKYADAVKIMVELLGYKEQAVLSGGYESGYFKIASDLKITKSVPQSNGGKLVWSSAARLVYNALNTETATLNVSDDSYSMKGSGKLLMNETMDIYMEKGILTANEFAGLYDIDGAGEKMIAVGGIKAKAFNSLAPEKYIGSEVECYYKENDNGNTVLYIVPTVQNYIVEISADEFESYESDKLTYTKADSGKIENVKLADNFFVIYNGRIKDDYNADTFKIDEGYIILTDNDGDKKADVINIQSYNDYVIAAIDAEEEIIYDTYGKTLDLSCDDNSKSVVISDSDGNEIALSDLSINQVLSVMADDNFMYIRAVLSTETVNGKIKTKYDDEGDTVVNIDGEEYILSKNVPSGYLSDYKMGNSGEFLINAFGKISYFKTETSEAVYAMIISTKYNADDENATVKYIDCYGAVKKQVVSEKCKVNGTKITDADDFIGSVSPKSVVLIKSNYNNEVQSVETESGNVLHAIGEKTSATYSGAQRWFGGKLTLQTETPIFVYPAENTTNVNEFFVARYTYLSEMSMKVQGFNQDSKSFLPDVVTLEKPSGSDTIQYDSPNMIVEKVYTKLDYDDEIIPMIDGYDFSGNFVSCKVKDNSVIQNFNFTTGDMIKVKKDINGYITEIDKFYDADTEKIPTTSKYVSSGLTAGFKPYIGYIYEKTDTMFGISGKKGTSTYDDVTYFRFENAGVITCEVEKKGKLNVTAGSVDMLTDYLNNSNASRVFMYTNSAIVKKIIILK